MGNQPDDASKIAPPKNDAIGDTEFAPIDSVRQARTTSAEDGPALVANRYELLGMLGGGAMGTVYRARDRELDEIVALKVLRRELAATEGMLERFRREVKLARRVTHRNVARTFDIGEHGGDRFLTMELVRGEGLASLLTRRGRLPLGEVVSIGRDVCAGLSAAHAAGVLHRDLKPDNVVLAEDGRAVITDFGIARAASEAELGRTVGGIVGTPAYMAPEQVEGAPNLDGRADLYALGAMIFELLTGNLPWTGETVIAVAAARLLQPPPDPRSHVPDLPARAAEVVLSLMARRKEDRFANAEEAGHALGNLVASDTLPPVSITPVSASHVQVAAPAPAVLGKVPTSAKTVAVLPLVNLGPKDDEYLAQTLTEDLVDLLSVVPELRVRPRGQTAKMDDAARDVRELGRTLNVDVVVDGSIRRIGESVRIAVRLVTVEDGFQLWARRFERSPAKVLTVADEAAGAIARALATEHAAQPRQATTDSVAQELYLRGRYLMHRGWFESARQAVGMLREAWQRAPTDARIGGTYALSLARIMPADDNNGETTREARSVADKALAMSPTQAEARVALGLIHLGASESAAAATELGRALAVSPNAVEALDSVGRLLAEAGRPEVGIETLRRALAIDPELSQARHTIGRIYGLYADIEAFEEAMGPFPEHLGDLVPYLMTRARVLLWSRDTERAKALLPRLTDLALSPYARASIDGLFEIASTLTLSPALRPKIDVMLSLDAPFAPRRLCFHAQLRVEIKLATGDVDAAMKDLLGADAHGLVDLVWLDRCPLFDGLRDRAEFVTVRAKTAARAQRVLQAIDDAHVRFS